MSALNIALDPLLIFGAGPLPALGVAGAGWATSLSQVVAALAAAALVSRRLGFAPRVPWGRASALLVVGRDMVLRTGALILFLLVASRAALHAGVAEGAAHQAIRQVWVFSALLLDAFAVTAQSLIGYFLGAGEVALARRVAARCCAWGLAAGGMLGAALVGLEGVAASLLVPAAAHGVFSGAWWVSAWSQPMNALCFVTDGIHWGTGDFPWLRNASMGAAAVGIAALLALDPSAPAALARIWGITAVWVGIRCGAGVVRIWPGQAGAPLGRRGS